MRELRLSIDDLMTALRGNQVFSIEEVQFAIVETTGSVSVYLKKNTSHSRCKMQTCTPKPSTPVTLISDGKLSRNALHSLQKEHSWVAAELQRRKLQEKDVFLLTADRNGICTCIPKQFHEKGGATS